MKLWRMARGLVALTQEKFELLLARLTGRSPAPIDARTQYLLKRKTRGMVLYQLSACSKCCQVRRVIRERQLPLEIRNADRFEIYRNEMVRGGGKADVPCLHFVDQRGEAHWIYEPKQIIQTLEALAA